MRAEALECLAFEHFPVLWMCYADKQLCTLLEAPAVKIYCTVFRYYPVCVRPGSDNAAAGVDGGDDLVLSFVGAGCKCGDALAALGHAGAAYEFKLSAGAAEDTHAYGVCADLACKVYLRGAVDIDPFTCSPSIGVQI